MIEAAFLGTVIPTLFLLLVLRHSRPTMIVFCWGMVAFMLGRYANNALIASLGVADVRTAIIFVAPPVEEFFKILPLFYFLFLARDSFLPFIYIFGAVSGIGFSIEENLLYLLAHHEAIAASLLYMIARSLSTCLMHAISAAAIGFLFTFIRKKKGMSYCLIPAGYLCAVAFHSAYNALINSAYTGIGMLLAFVAYVASAIVMRFSAERMFEAKDTSWQ